MMTSRPIRSVMPIRLFPPAGGMTRKTVLRRPAANLLTQRVQGALPERRSPRGAGMAEQGFAGRGAVVTGAGAGIGRAIATAFARRGAEVAVVDLHPDRVADTVGAIADGPGRAFAVPGDVRTQAGVERIIEGAARHLGHLDILVNNAGVYPNCPVLDMPEDQWDSVIDTNLKGTFLMSQAGARRMVAERRGGHIVDIASAACKYARRGGA